MSDTFNAVRACAISLLAGDVLQADLVSAGNGIVIDWRTVRSGETLQSGADAFDTAQLFVALVGVDAAFRAVGQRASDPEPPVSTIDGSRVRLFGTKRDARLGARSIGWPASSIVCVSTRFQRAWALGTGIGLDPHTKLPYVSREWFGELYRGRNGDVAPSF